ncbi:uncharacterized protein LOC127417392 [Myxocyprinus asiaticus]|uniref:uncharacterized protein LOC127417392 n=1 Tax=Myxocyprinus asiaticus TaxID=70543 RepID=UPI0022234A93|nr:uncharacterized protein LOC127417392 [Myxocyprinus asiaticus]
MREKEKPLENTVQEQEASEKNSQLEEEWTTLEKPETHHQETMLPKEQQQQTNDPGQFQEQARETSHMKDEGKSKAVKPTLVKRDSWLSSTNSHGYLKKQFTSLREADTVDKSDIVLVFCPIISRAVIDIEAALKKFNVPTVSKPAALVVLHHTFDPEKTVRESSRFVNREDILTVDCLFYEDTGLLQCLKNSEAINKVVNWLKQQRKKIGVKVCPPQNIRQKPTRNISEMPDKGEKTGVKVQASQNKLASPPSLHKWPIWTLMSIRWHTFLLHPVQ